MRRLHRLRLDQDIAVMPIGAVVRPAFTHRPAFQDQPDRFVEARRRGRRIDHEAAELSGPIAAADPETEPPVPHTNARRRLPRPQPRPWPKTAAATGGTGWVRTGN